jgi:hypothetical protein
MDALRIHGKPKFRAEFNCWLICKQRLSGPSLEPTDSEAEYAPYEIFAAQIS